jgi:hypothetical protein
MRAARPWRRVEMRAEWEYRAIAMYSEHGEGPRSWVAPSVDTDAMDELGQYGWELVSVVVLGDHCKAVFKRLVRREPPYLRPLPKKISPCVFCC